jgi:CheY-like chemotaxis protein
MEQDYQQSPAGVLEGRRLLVVEDDTDTRELLRAILEDSGARMVAADGFASAMDALKEFTPDVLVLDIGMPKYNGYALIAKIRSLTDYRQIPAVAVTAFITPTDRDTALAAGFQAHIAKPFEPDKLVAVISKLLTVRQQRTA